MLKGQEEDKTRQVTVFVVGDHDFLGFFLTLVFKITLLKLTFGKVVDWVVLLGVVVILYGLVTVTSSDLYTSVIICL